MAKFGSTMACLLGEGLSSITIARMAFLVIIGSMK